MSTKSFERIQIQDICDVFDGPHATPKKQPYGPIYLGIDAITNDGTIDYSALTYLSESDYVKWTKRVTPKEGDIVFSYEATLGRYAIIPANFYGCLGRRLAIVRKKKPIINTLWLYYYFRSPEWTAFIKSHIVKGSTVDRISIEDFPYYTVPKMPIVTQNSIAAILSMFDEKVASNKAINDNLEQQLRTIYDYWFTQFDFPDENGNPYRSSGGKMVWNDELKREIPDGWECRTLASLLHRHQDAFDYKTEQPTVDLSIMPSSSISIDRINSSDMFATNLYQMDEGDLLFGSIRPYLQKAGIAPCNGVVAGTVHCFQVNNVQDYNFALFTLCGRNIFDYAIKVSKGTKMPVISAEDLLAYKVPYSKEIARRFNDFPVKNTICKNVKEIHKLTKLRDWLLPMLMNGQATVAN